MGSRNVPARKEVYETMATTTTTTTTSQQQDKDQPSASVLAVEQKPHRVYIRYLMTKKWAPSKIQHNLFQLGLSSPIEEVMTQYYHSMIKPLIKKYNLGHIYQDYNNYVSGEKGAKKKRHPDELNFRTNIGVSIDDQINFLRFINDLGVNEMWQNELYLFYGDRDRVPSDPMTGKALIPSFSRRSGLPWSIVQSPHRYLVDEMILEGVPDSRIIEMMRQKYDTKIASYDISMYKAAFFSVQMLDIRDQLKSLDAEKQNLQHHIKGIDSAIKRIESGEAGESTETIPDLLSKKKALYTRVNDLGTNIRSLNASFSEAAAKHKGSKDKTRLEMFEEMMDVTYQKFKRLSIHNDRDVIDPLYKLTRMMSLELDLVEKARDMDLKNRDGAQVEMIRLIHAREEELEREREYTEQTLSEYADNVLYGSEIDASEILGLDELQKSADPEEK